MYALCMAPTVGPDAESVVRLPFLAVGPVTAEVEWLMVFNRVVRMANGMAGVVRSVERAVEWSKWSVEWSVGWSVEWSELLVVCSTPPARWSSRWSVECSFNDSTPMID